MHMIKKNVSIVTNVAVLPFIKEKYESKLRKKTYIISVQSVQPEILNEKENINIISESDMVIVWIDFIEQFDCIVMRYLRGEITFENAIQKLIQWCDKIKELVLKHTNSEVVWIGFENTRSCVSKLSKNKYVKNDLCDKLNSYIVDNYSQYMDIINLTKIVYSVGSTESYNRKNEHRWGCIYSQELINRVIESVEIEKRIEQYEDIKCIVVDCDNVLWGGEIQEVGISGIKIGGFGVGKSYAEFQKQLCVLYYLGYVLAICTKNDYTIIEDVFKRNSAMELSLDMFSVVKANWRNKSKNIIDISEQLNISLENMLFIDDMEYEIKEVESKIPNIKAVKFDINSWTAAEFGFSVKTILDLHTARIRQQSYKNNELRKNIMVMIMMVLLTIR